MFISIVSISRCITLWICFIFSIMACILINNTNNEMMTFFRFGPHENLIIIGIQINTIQKYLLLVSYTFFNSGIRTINHNYIQSWIINNIQDNSKLQYALSIINIYEIVLINVLYTWFDWFMYINILLSQIDMVIIEIIADIIMTFVTTHYYMYLKNNCINSNNNALITVDNLGYMVDNY